MKMSSEMWLKRPVEMLLKIDREGGPMDVLRSSLPDENVAYGVVLFEDPLYPEVVALLHADGSETFYTQEDSKPRWRSTIWSEFEAPPRRWSRRLQEAFAEKLRSD